MELKKEELEMVNGGYFVYEDDGGRFYQFVGKKSQRDMKYMSKMWQTGSLWFRMEILL